MVRFHPRCRRTFLQVGDLMTDRNAVLFWVVKWSYQGAVRTTRYDVSQVGATREQVIDQLCKDFNVPDKRDVKILSAEQQNRP